MTTRVQCRRGEVEIELTGEPLVQFYCHCDDCQTVHGAAYAPESVYPSGAVTVVRGTTSTPRAMTACGTRDFAAQPCLAHSRPPSRSHTTLPSGPRRKSLRFSWPSGSIVST